MTWETNTFTLTLLPLWPPAMGYEEWLPPLIALYCDTHRSKSVLRLQMGAQVAFTCLFSSSGLLRLLGTLGTKGPFPGHWQESWGWNEEWGSLSWDPQPTSPHPEAVSCPPAVCHGCSPAALVALRQKAFHSANWCKLCPFQNVPESQNNSYFPRNVRADLCPFKNTCGVKRWRERGPKVLHMAPR